jgi:isocitrate lyase
LKEYNRSLQESFARVDKALARLNGKRLTPEQAETADRIRTFRKQAEQAREQDLVTAVSLAKRADLLAKDLIERLP